MSVSSTIRNVLESKSAQNVCTIKPSESVYRALELMAENNIGSVLVMEDDSILGIFSERDYARRLALHGKRSRETKVSEIMSSPVLYVSPDETVESCMALMTERRVRHLPVLEDGTLTGIISIGDVVKSAIADREFLIEQLIHYISGTPAPSATEVSAPPPAPLKAVG